MSRLLKKKTAYFFVGISLVCLILGPLFGLLLDKMTLYETKPEIIQEDSGSGMKKAFAYPVTLSKDQKLIIEVSNFYSNSSITIRILAKSVYDRAYSLNSTTSGVSGLEFVYSEFGWGSSPAGSTSGDNSLSLPSDGIYFYIEFMGGRNGISLISWPGDYYVVVYGFNTGPSSITAVPFDITIKTDGPGEALNNIFILIGALIIIVYVMAVLISVLKANYLR